MRIGLVGCVKTKQEVPAAARELYTSPLFLGRRAAVEDSCDRWFVLSALHGLVMPDEVLEPYDLELRALPVADRRRWSQDVLTSLHEELGELGTHVFEVHAGAEYTSHGLDAGLRRAGATVELPVAGLSFGQQLAWYAGRGSGAEVLRGTGRTPRTAKGDAESQTAGGRYEPLHDHLAALADEEVTLSFPQIEAIIGTALPPSASQHRAWWSNGRHSQSRAWLAAGYVVDDVDQDSGWVRFRRAR